MTGSGKNYDIIIVGSGTGGATVAKELAEIGKDVLVVEKGSHFSSFGSFDDIVQFHDASVLPVSPGLPPILTIVALGKYLTNQLYN